MSLLEAMILGIIQGLTEFLPISSSGHLVLAQSLLNIDQPGNEFEILVHIGTLFSVLIVFRNDIINLLTSLQSKKSQKFIILIIIGTIPAIFIGLGLKDILESFFDDLAIVSIALIFTGLILCSTFLINNKKNNEHTILTSIFIGCAQAIAIIPGISRSGMTISVALLLGISPKEATKFSFLLAIPAIGGAGILTAFNMDINNSEIYQLSGFVGMLTSFLIGFIALKWLLIWIEKGKLYYFGLYCIIIGFMTLIL